MEPGRRFVPQSKEFANARKKKINIFSPSKYFLMKIFISWSGDRSRHIASLLKEWIENCFQNAEAFMSQHDINPGAKWAAVLNEELEKTNFGILCLTPENLHQDWILFEAGAIAKSVSNGRVIPLLWQLQPGDISQPLAQFNNLFLDDSGLFKLNQEINRNIDKPLPSEKVKIAYDAHLPKAKEQIAKIPLVPHGKKPDMRSDRNMLEELLELARDHYNITSRYGRIRNTSESILLTKNISEIKNFIKDCLDGAIEARTIGESDIYKAKAILGLTILKSKYPELTDLADSSIAEIEDIKIKK